MSLGKKVVCVTGASGFLASWLVKNLLQRGYTVKATVRNLSDPTKVDHLKALDGADERLHLFEADLLQDGSFDSAIDGCEGVFHTASPAQFTVNDPQAELIAPAVEGTLNVLKSCRKVDSVRRVVFTSSLVTVICNTNPKAPGVLVDETWFSDKLYCQQAKLWYALSKVMAEEAAWKFAQVNGIDLVVMVPGLVLGPTLQPAFNLSTQITLDIIKDFSVVIQHDAGKEIYYAGERPFPTYEIVDIRDVIEAHILGFENPSAKGRYCLVGTTLSHSQMHQILHNLYPSITSPFTGPENPTYEVSKKKAESLGINFMPLEMSLNTAVEFLKENNLLRLN